MSEQVGGLHRWCWALVAIAFLLGVIGGGGAGYYWAFFDLDAHYSRIANSAEAENSYLREELKRLRATKGIPTFTPP